MPKGVQEVVDSLDVARRKLAGYYAKARKTLLIMTIVASCFAAVPPMWPLYSWWLVLTPYTLLSHTFDLSKLYILDAVKPRVLKEEGKTAAVVPS